MARNEELYDAGDVDAVQERKVNEGRKDKARKEALKRIMSDPALREWMWHLLGLCHTEATSLSDNVYRVYAMEGERNIGLIVKAEIEEVAPVQYAEMILEKAKLSQG